MSAAPLSAFFFVLNENYRYASQIHQWPEFGMGSQYAEFGKALTIQVMAIPNTMQCFLSKSVFDYSSNTNLLLETGEV